jgi:hypothetical protein
MRIPAWVRALMIVTAAIPLALIAIEVLKFGVSR